MKKTHLFLTPLLCVFLFLQSCEDEPVDNEMITEEPVNLKLCIPSDLQSNVLAYYPFADGSLEDVFNENNLSNNTNAQPTTDINGNLNCAFYFNSETVDFLTTTNAEFLNNLSELSISLWFKNDDPVNDGSYDLLISRDEDLSCPDTYGQWSLGFYDCRSIVFARLNSVWDRNCNGEIDYDNWIHYVVTYAVQDNRISMYRDGILRESETGIGVCNGGPTYEDIGDLIIGRFFTGTIDDIAIFDIELDQSQVNTLYQSEPCCI
jgi:hypothetical protein